MSTLYNLVFGTGPKEPKPKTAEELASQAIAIAANQQKIQAERTAASKTESQRRLMETQNAGIRDQAALAEIEAFNKGNEIVDTAMRVYEKALTPGKKKRPPPKEDSCLSQIKRPKEESGPTLIQATPRKLSSKKKNKKPTTANKKHVVSYEYDFDSMESDELLATLTPDILQNVSVEDFTDAFVSCGNWGLFNEACKPRKRGKKLGGDVLRAFCQGLNDYHPFELNYEDLDKDYQVAELLVDALEEGFANE